MSHTPGPWALDGEEVATHDGKTILGYYFNSPASGGRIGRTFVNCLVTTDAESLANARLLAASPTMLDALRKAALALAHITETHPEYMDAYEAVDAAIWKAISDIPHESRPC